MLLALFKTNSERRTSMDKDQVELYHNLGLMPDWVYYQLNGKSANENYRDIVNKRNQAFKEELLKALHVPQTAETENYNLNITSEIKFR